MSQHKPNYKPAVLFILKFVGLYLVLNTVYGFYIESFEPESDPLTVEVTQQVSFLLNLAGEQTSAIPLAGSVYIALQNENAMGVNVFEGCNSVNVLIVYLSFLVAFTGNLKRTLIYVIVGTVTIYVMNLLRVGLLFEVAVRFPAQLYFFHKYLFTAFIYGVVFLIWYAWVRQMAKRTSRVEK